jgi:hypothetical protein
LTKSILCFLDGIVTSAWPWPQGQETQPHGVIRLQFILLSLTFVCKTPQSFFLPSDSPLYHISLPRGLSLLYSVYFCPFISVFSSQTRVSTGTTTTDPCLIQRRNHMTSRTTPKILFHIPKITNYVVFQRDTHHIAKNTDRVIHPVGQGHVVSYGQCPSPSSNGILATTSPPHGLSPPSPPPVPFQRQHVAFAPAPSYSTSGLNVPPPPFRN